ncbi:hypothetical protein SVAN01_09419 [Stagonosporopsis vannaccii]|nr:hypothetical protein SVAN01_09419 [Stagonosporopsis vannaccii]
MSQPLNDGGEPRLSLAQPSQPATPDVPSLVHDDRSAFTISPAPATEFRRPAAPSATSSRRRRTRDDDDGSTSSPSKRSRLSDSAFAATYKDRLRAEYAGCCCVCRVTHNLHGAHVFDKAAAPEFERSRRRGLVSLETLGDFDNAIFVCACDHAAFDATYPQLIVIPTYLDYFIDHEQRWQDEMTGTVPPTARAPVTPGLYAAHCSRVRGQPLTHGLYTAYPVVDYKNKDDIGVPQEFQWHGDPGAIIWKAKQLIGAELTLHPRPAHLRDLKHARTMLARLRDLREEGDEKWSDACAAQQSALDGPPSDPPSEPRNGGAAASPGDTLPPPHAPSSGRPGVAHDAPTSSPFPTTYFSLAASSPYLSTTHLKRKRDAFDHSKQDHDADTLHIPVTEQPQGKRAKAITTRHTSMQRQQGHHRPTRWGGPKSSTEETVRYWNAIFRTDERAVSKPP